MTDILNIAWEVLKELFRSDVDGHVPHWAYTWLAVFVAHTGMGMMVALSCARNFAVLLLVGYVAKELAFDLRTDGYAIWSWADSAADTFALTLGYSWGAWATGRDFLLKSALTKARARFDFG